MGRDLGSSHHIVARNIMGRQPKRWVGGIWEYPTLDTSMEEAGFEEMEAYVIKSENAVAHYIKMRTILDLCKDMVHRSGA